MSEAVILEKYDPNWVTKFIAEKQRIEHRLGPGIDGGVEHVGSTAIPNMDAKPIIDIMVGVADLGEAESFISLLEDLGYCYFPYKADIMHWFCKPSPEHREYHLYLIEHDSSEWRARLAFRDYLRRHPEVAQEYLELKQSLAKKFKHDREEYTLAKASFAKQVVEKAAKP